MGYSLAGRSRARLLCVVRRADELYERDRVREREQEGRGEIRQVLAGRPAHDREGNYPVSCGVLAGVPDGGGAAAAEADIRARLAALRAGEDEQVEGERGVSGADREGVRRTHRRQSWQ